MQEFMFQPPNAILYIAAGVLGIGILSAFLKKGERTRKFIAIAIIVVVAVALVILVYRPITLTVDADGIRTNGAGAIEITWAEVEHAYFEPDLPNSEYRPTVRTRGTAIGDYRTGRFLLSNGDQARLLMERSDATVVIETADLTYLFAPADAEGLAQAIDELRR